MNCKFCRVRIQFIDRIPYEINGFEHRCLSAAPPKVYQCNRCSKVISFKDRKPMNPDGTPHRCLSKPEPHHFSFDPETGEIFNP